MKNRRFLIRLLCALLAAAALTALSAAPFLRRADNALCDTLYQRPSATDGEIVVVGIDQRALEAFGPLPWDRSLYADAIFALNSDPAAAPAVIGVDVIFAGERESDGYLAEAAAFGGNVVVASAADLGEAVVETGGGQADFYLDPMALLAWDEPFEALRSVTETGHINALLDTDGYIRHALWSLEVPGRGEVRSFALVVYERWCRAKGIAPAEKPVTTGRGLYYAAYHALPGGYYDGISIADVIDGEVDPSFYAGKIVPIGPYAAGMADDYYTAIEHSEKMYGVEIQANLLDAFRTGDLPREANGRLMLLLSFLIAFAMLLFFWDRKVPQAVAGWLVVCLGWLGLCLLLRRFGWLLPVLWVPLYTTVLFVAAVAVNYIRAQWEKKKVTATFGRYVDPAVLRQLLEVGGDALELGGRLCEIAVLFVDIRGFTTMSESLPPPTVVEIINRYLTLTTECVMRWHGTLDKFVGDCTMAFWNAPIEQEDPVYLACRAAMDMVKGSEAVGQELMERFGRTVSFGVGVHVGPAVVGNIGAPMRMDYTAIGDTVNTASRLESNAPGGTIYISRAVADALGDRAQTTSLGGSVPLKGKAAGFEVLTLDALREETESGKEDPE